MRERNSSLCAVAVVLMSALVLGCAEAASRETPWTWQEPQAKVLPQGDLEWAPHPFEFEKGDSVRYIDYEGGDDDAAGTSKDSAWKHHPWDENAEGKAAACAGAHTYVFKRGVVYRGSLTGSVAGKPDDPVRLTSDPDWGEGEAALVGSAQPGRWQRAGASDVPEGMPEPGEVWYAELPEDWTPRKLWQLDGDEIVELKLARTPNWEITDWDDIKSQWWQWEKGSRQRRGGTGIDTEHLTESPDYYEDAMVYTEWGIVMSTPVAIPVTGFDPDKHALSFEGFWTPNTGMRIEKGMRYYLENKPHYLDEDGEWYFEDEGPLKGRLYVRLPDGGDPNGAHLEAARHKNIIDLRDVENLDTSGLTFRFTNVDEPGRPGFKIYEDDHDVSAVRLQGNVVHAAVRNCRFDHVNNAVLVDVDAAGNVGEDILIADNDVFFTDHSAFEVENSYQQHGSTKPEHPTPINGLKIVRNRVRMAGRRPHRGSHGHTVTVSFAETAEIAGNILDRIFGAGLFIFGGKPSGEGTDDRPLSRIVVHHNKATNTLLHTNDWGGIETWQGGPFYVYNNISGNPGGYRHWRWLRQKDADEEDIGHVGTRFGHAYYMDGSFKNYQFNNIAWGEENDLRSPLMNTAAFQEIHSYQNRVFNCTVHRFGAGTRRQAPHGGRNLYLGNIWSDISDYVFIHARPTSGQRAPNEPHAGPRGEHIPYETLGYAHNVFYDISRYFGVFEVDGIRRETPDEMSTALETVGALASGVGTVAEEPPLRNAEAGDWRPAEGSPAIDNGVQCFVPWSLHGTVGEWHFHRNNDESHIVQDDHWYMSPLYNDRETYHKLPTWPLEGKHVLAEHYVDGPLEDWTQSALQLDGRGQFLRAHLPDPGGAKEVLAEADQPTTSTFEDWLTVEHPSGIVPKHPFSITVKTEGVPDDHLVSAELHCRKHGGWGGFVASGGAPQKAGEGPLEYNFEPRKKADLKEYVLVIYHGETGGWDEKDGKAARITVPYVSEVKAGMPGQFRTPDISGSSLIVEAYVKIEPGDGGILAQKMGDDAGYAVTVADDGRAQFVIRTGGGTASVKSNAILADGEWHHLLAEADRQTLALTIYMDGEEDASGRGFGPDVSLSNDASFYVGGTPDRDKLAATIDFLRVARGSLADSRTTIDELYEWQFNGPFLRDFCGNEPVGQRDAGAVELMD